MIEYIINIHLPVLIYFIIHSLILFLKIYLNKNNNKKKLLKFLVFLILGVIFLEFLYQKNFKRIVWSISLSPIFTLFLAIIILGYIVLFWKKNNKQTISQRIQIVKNFINMIYKIRNSNSISILNQVRTILHK